MAMRMVESYESGRHWRGVPVGHRGTFAWLWTHTPLRSSAESPLVHHDGAAQNRKGRNLPRMRVIIGTIVACSLSIISVWAAHLLGAWLGEGAHRVALDEGMPLRIGWMIAIVIMAALGMVVAGYFGAVFATG